MTKKVNVIIFLISIILIFLLFFIWQYRLGEKQLSCAGDWSYNVKCPFGTTCSEISDPLAGGYCTPWINLSSK